MAMAIWGLGLPIGLAAFAMVSWFAHDPTYLRERQVPSEKVDYLGIIYLAVGLGLLQLVLDRGQRLDWLASKWIWYGSIISRTRPDPLALP